MDTVRSGGIVTKKEAIRMLGIEKREFNERMAKDPNFPKASDGNRKRRWMADDIFVYKAIMCTPQRLVEHPPKAIKQRWRRAVA